MQVKAHTVALDVQDIQKLERLVPELPPDFQEVLAELCHLGKDCRNCHACIPVATFYTSLSFPLLHMSSHSRLEHVPGSSPGEQCGIGAWEVSSSGQRCC